MSYPPQQPPVTPGYTSPPQGDWTPPRPKSKAVPLLVAALVLALITVAGLTYLLVGRDKPAVAPKAIAATSAAKLAEIHDECSVVAGYNIEDAGRTLVMTVGNQFMSAETMNCVFDRLGTPDAVRQHVSTTRALDGQQTDSWPGYSARWTYHPDDGLQMTIRVS